MSAARRMDAQRVRTDPAVDTTVTDADSVRRVGGLASQKKNALNTETYKFEEKQTVRRNVNKNVAVPVLSSPPWQQAQYQLVQRRHHRRLNQQQAETDKQG